MAAGATMHRFEIALADSDRGVYEALELRVARHPSESAAFMLVRVLAYCLEYAEGIAFSKGGVSDTDEPAISISDLTGHRKVWIEIGAPSADRLHRASKATERVVLYTDRRPAVLRVALAGERIHRGDELKVISFPQPFLRALEAKLERTSRWDVSMSDGHLYVTIGNESFDTIVEAEPLLGAPTD